MVMEYIGFGSIGHHEFVPKIEYLQNTKLLKMFTNCLRQLYSFGGLTIGYSNKPPSVSCCIEISCSTTLNFCHTRNGFVNSLASRNYDVFSQVDKLVIGNLEKRIK